ncbi:hypothetical protein KM043_007193 [Ampulex compressa]|nr:hypothetical protein KM043_007193 [Ampulex compressa]
MGDERSGSKARRYPKVSSRPVGPANSANSANCVIPKSVVDRLDVAAGSHERGWSKMAREEAETGEDDANTAATATSVAIPGTFSTSWQLRHVAATTKRSTTSSSPPSSSSSSSSFFFLSSSTTSSSSSRGATHTILAYLLISYSSIEHDTTRVWSAPVYLADVYCS